MGWKNTWECEIRVERRIGRFLFFRFFLLFFLVVAVLGWRCGAVLLHFILSIPWYHTTAWYIQTNRRYFLSIFKLSIWQFGPSGVRSIRSSEKLVKRKQIKTIASFRCLVFSFHLHLTLTVTLPFRAKFEFWITVFFITVYCLVPSIFIDNNFVHHNFMVPSLDVPLSSPQVDILFIFIMRFVFFST